MLSRQEAKLNMYRSVQQLCNDNNSTIAGNAAFMQAFTAFSAKINSIISTATSESQAISGIAIDKGEAKKALAKIATDTAGIIFAYASSINNNTLKQIVNYSYTDFYRLKDDLFAPTATNIVNAANDNLAALASYGVSPAMITTLQNTIDDYSTSVPKPTTARSVRSTYTDNIKDLVAETDALLKDQLDKLVVSFTSEHPDFVSSYKKARVIIDEKETPTQIKGTVAGEDDQPVQAIITITGISTAMAQANRAGEFIIKPVVPGTYKLKIVSPGYPDYEQEELLVKKGKITTVDIVLKK